MSIAKIIKLPLLAAAILATVVFTTGCPGTENTGASNADNSALDLIKLQYAARQLRETGVMNLSSPMSSYYLLRGWSSAFTEGPESPALTAATEKEAILQYSVIRPANRWLKFNVKTKSHFGGPEKQQVKVSAAGQELAVFTVGGDEFQQQQVFIPAELQKPGGNQVLFHFSEMATNPTFPIMKRSEFQKFPYPGVAAYFSEFRVDFGDETGPAGYPLRDETTAFTPIAGGERLAQYPNSSLVYAFDIQKGSAIRFSGTMEGKPGEQGKMTLSISAKIDSQPDLIPLWSKEYSIGEGSYSQSFSGDIPLDDVAGQIAELHFSALSSNDYSESFIAWKQLEMMVPPHSNKPQASAERQPIRINKKIKNVIIILLDAARPDHIGAYGDDRKITPNIDNFSVESLLFENAVSSAPYTIASVSTLFSGLTPESHGARSVTEKFPDYIETMPRAFKQKGFYTIALAGTKFITRQFGLTVDCDDVINLRDPEDKEGRFTTMDEAAMEAEVKKAAASGKPVFLYAHFLPPHWPYRPPAPFNSKFIAKPKVKLWRSWMVKALFDNHLADQNYPDVVTHHKRYMNNYYYADYVTRKLLDMLYENGMYDDSIIMVMADHGEAFGEHNSWGHNTTVYDTMIRVPLIIRIPGVKPGRVAQQVGLIDVFPTLAELFDLDVKGTKFDGKSLVPLIMNGVKETGDYYYARASGNKLTFSLRGDRFKYVHDDYKEEFFDLKADPDELHNIIDQHRALASLLRQKALVMIAVNSSLRNDQGRDVELSKEDEDELRNLGYLN